MATGFQSDQADLPVLANTHLAHRTSVNEYTNTVNTVNILYMFCNFMGDIFFQMFKSNVRGSEEIAQVG